jgi:hypothetical protein
VRRLLAHCNLWYAISYIMQLPHVSGPLPRCLVLALWLISGDALGQGINAQWQAPAQARSIERLPPWLRDAFHAVPRTRDILADIQRHDDNRDRLRLELFLSAGDLDEARRAEDMVGGYPVRVSYGVLTEGHGGRRFVLATFFHGYTCGASSCSIYFLMQRSGRWRFAGEAGGVDVSFAGQAVRGFPVFMIHDRGDPCPYRWNGAQFWGSSGCRDW